MVSEKIERRSQEGRGEGPGRKREGVKKIKERG
jgi:hypothetical protein